MRLCGVTSLYVPKNAIGWSKAGWRNTKRYAPPVRTSMLHESIDIPNDFGTHQRLNNSGLLHASKTMCAGALNVRVTTSSRSALRSTAVRFMAAGLPSFPSGICLLLAFQVLDNLVQRVEACAPELAVPLDPGGLFFQRAHAKPAGSDAPGLFSSDERCPLQHANMLLHARKGHMELSGEVRDRSVGAAELLQHAAPGRVRQRGERSVQVGFVILNHMVQYITPPGGMQGEAERKMHTRPIHSWAPLGGVSGEVNGPRAHSLPQSRKQDR